MIFKTATILFILSSSLSLADAESNARDILRFKNGDQLHGNFLGILKGPQVNWSRDDLSEKIAFKTKDVRQVVLRAGEPKSSLKEFSHLGTVNGDRIPGKVVRLDEENILFETKFGETLEIPRKRVGLIAPQPMGGRVLYHGPFASDGWTMVDMLHPEGLPLEADPEDQDKSPRWAFSGSAWYWQHEDSGTALVRRGGLPERSVLKFDIGWKSRLSLAIGFHSNFKRPASGENENNNALEPQRRSGSVSLPHIFGDSYVLHLYSNYLQLYRTGFDDEGKPIVDRLNISNGEVGLSESNSATVEIRCNQRSGEVMLFINDAFVLQWTEPVIDGRADQIHITKGDGFGFLTQSNKSPVKISEIVVAEWNGIPDAARSMQVESSDIVILTNGTDRFSGKVTMIKDDKLSLEGRYGDFIFPLEEIAEVRFASDDLIEAEADSGDTLMVRMHPIGRVTGQPLAGPPGKVRLLNKAAGEIEINLDSAVMLEFESSKNFIDDWNIEF